MRASKHRAAFLAAYRATASISKAADSCKIERGLHYRWLTDETYAYAFAAARDEAAQTLEDEAIRRAHEGVLDPVFYKGKPVGAIRVYSDSLLTFLLKGFRPEKYRDRGQVELTGPGGDALSLTVSFVSPVVPVAPGE